MKRPKSTSEVHDKVTVKDSFAGMTRCRTLRQPGGWAHLLAQLVQWSEDVINADPFFGRSRVRFRVPPWVSNTIARDHLA